jgi:DNA primase
MPLIDLRRAKRELTLGAVLQLLGWHPSEQTAQQARGPCPIHGSRSARSRSFSAHLGRGVWQCFVCGAKGNALELWMKKSEQQLYPAVLDLCQRLRREVPWLESPTPQTKGKK